MNVDALRLMNILQNIGGSNQPSPTQPNQGVIQQPQQEQLNAAPQIPNSPVMEPGMGGDNDLMSKLQAMFTPNHNALDNYSNQLSQMPQRENYQPSKTRQILAAIGSMGAGGPATYQDGAALGFKANIPQGLQIGEAIRNMPYDRAVGDWDLKNKPLGDLANIEGRDNVNRGNMANDIMNRNNQSRNTDRMIDRDIATNKINEGKLAATQHRNMVYEYKARNPNHQLKVDEDGYIIGVEPVTLKSHRVLDDNGQPVKSSVLSQYDKTELDFQNQLALIDARGNKQIDVNAASSDNQLNREKELIPLRGDTAVTTDNAKTDNRIKVKKTLGAGTARSGSGANASGLTPAQRQIEQYMRSQEAANNPAWAPYIIPQQGKNFKIGMPPKGNLKTLNQVRKYIYGDTALNQQPEIGDKKTFPNGAIGTWDGTGWAK